MQTDFYADTNVGKVRKHNEDTFLLEKVWNGTHLLAAAIDGVGGNAGGEVAANIAKKCISEHITGACNSNCSADVLKAAVIYANNSILTMQHYNPYLSRMSCVLTAVLINLESGIMNVCHVGDTRLYMLKNGLLTRITSDHSLVGPLEASGEISELQAMTHPRRNIITRSVGHGMLYRGSDYIQTHTVQLESCTLLLCSDGLYDMVPSSRTSEILEEPLSAKARVCKLIEAAIEAGGKDNVTAIVIDLAI